MGLRNLNTLDTINTLQARAVRYSQESRNSNVKR
jgi:hypothetical protein